MASVMCWHFGMQEEYIFGASFNHPWNKVTEINPNMIEIPIHYRFPLGSSSRIAGSTLVIKISITSRIVFSFIQKIFKFVCIYWSLLHWLFVLIISALKNISQRPLTYILSFGPVPFKHNCLWGCGVMVVVCLLQWKLIYVNVHNMHSWGGFVTTSSSCHVINKERWLQLVKRETKVCGMFTLVTSDHWPWHDHDRTF